MRPIGDPRPDAFRLTESGCQKDVNPGHGKSLRIVFQCGGERTKLLTAIAWQNEFTCTSMTAVRNLYISLLILLTQTTDCELP